MPKVSIITPLYNGEKYIGKNIESILGQTYRDFEHIVVDDGSTDRSAEMVRSFGKAVVYFEQKNAGQAAAVNAGIKASRGEYVGFCDQDDWWLPEKLERQVKFLEENKDVALVYTDAFLGDEGGRVLHKTWMQSRKVNYADGGYQECAVKLFDRNFIPAPLTVLVRKSVFDKIGLLNEKFSSAYDYDFWFRVLEAGYRIGYLKEPLAVWRTHAGQESRNIRKAKKMLIGILGLFLKRKHDFFREHPFLVIKKYIKAYGALLFG